MEIVQDAVNLHPLYFTDLLLLLNFSTFLMQVITIGGPDIRAATINWLFANY